MAFPKPQFIPGRVQGLDPRTKTIFDLAASLACGKHHLEQVTGATASWRRRKAGVTIRLESRADLAANVHSYDVEVRWRRQTVFRARFSQTLNAPKRGLRRMASSTVDLPGEWERLLAEAAAEGGAR